MVSLDGTSEDELEIVGAPTPKKMGGIEDIKGEGGRSDDASDSEVQSQKKQKYNTNDITSESTLPPKVPLPVGATWRIALLMDHREFGCGKSNFLEETEKKINKHFKVKGGTMNYAAAEITTLDSADYMFVARLISNSTGEIVDERVLDLVIERKNIVDLAQCLIKPSKKYLPLSNFEAQMYKFQHCGIRKKIFLMEGDEEKINVFAGANTKQEKLNRLKRIKTSRLRLDRGEWDGVDLVCTLNRRDSILFMIKKLEELQQTFNPRRPPTKTLQRLKSHINTEMKNPTFLEYLCQMKKGGVGDATAMKVIMDPKLDWDKTFVSPAGKCKPSKATLEDKATFWPEISTQGPTPSNTKAYRALASSIEERQEAVKAFDESVEGKERTSLNNKSQHSKRKMTAQDTADLAQLDSQRASLKLACGEANREKNDDGIAAAKTALKEWDASSDGKRRKHLTTKKNHSEQKLAPEELARLEELNNKRDTFSSKQQTHAEKSVSDCRKAAKAFDESAEGKERKKLEEKNKNSKTKMTREDTNDLAELDVLRSSLVHARDVAKRAKNDDELATAAKALVDWDATKAGRKRKNLKAKKNHSQKQMTTEESARLKELNNKRKNLTTAQPLLPDVNSMKIKDMKQELHSYGVSTTTMVEKIDVVDALIDARKVRYATPTNSATANHGTGHRLGTRETTKASFTGKRKSDRKEPPEQLYNELPKVGLLDGAKAGKKKTTTAASLDEDDDELCGLCFRSIDIWTEKDYVLCNRVAACGATFHLSCLTTQQYDIKKHDGCIKCEAKSKFSMKSNIGECGNGCQDGAGMQKRPIEFSGRADTKGGNDVVDLQDSDNEDKDDDVIIIN
mmetsp:Transcript_12114/g.26420  ORF Transcript_12114/g.26420 Transcript_12114/m.26420 type:complete len:851 (+) Transcript_12114:2-2554(+)